jgi:hypothetical protein
LVNLRSTKSAHLQVEGELRSREYEKDGVKRRIWECKAYRIAKLDRIERAYSDGRGRFDIQRPVEPEAALIIVQFVAGICSRLAKQKFHAIRGPRRYTSAEEVRILGPDWTFERQRRGEHWPILFIAFFQTPTSCCFKAPIHLAINAGDQFEQLIEHCHRRFRVDPSLEQDFRKMLPCLRDGRVWSEEFRLGKVSFQDSPNTLAENCANQYVRVENHHFRFEPFDADDALP